MSTTDLIVEKEFERRRKVVQAQRRYRQKLKGNDSKYKLYLEGRSMYMKNYKKTRQEVFEKAFQNYDPSKLQKNEEAPLEAPCKEKRVRKQVDLRIRTPIYIYIYIYICIPLNHPE